MRSSVRPIRARLASLIPIALSCAAIDVALVRRELDHRPASADQFGEAALLWLAFALLALVPAWLTDALLRRFARDRERFDAPARVGLRLAAWTAVPVLVHARLDHYTSIGGDLAPLRQAAPWLDALACAAGAVVAAVVLGRVLARAKPIAVVAGVSVVAVTAGLTVSFHAEPEPIEGPSATGKPNVLLLVWDTTRAQSLELYGYDRETTPHLAGLADRALVFSRARSASSYTLSSHLSMLTGVHPSHHGARLVRQRINPRATPSVAEAFRAAGYRTGAFVGTGVLAAQTGASHAFETFDDQVDPALCDTHAWALVHDLQAIGASLVPALENNGRPHWIQDFQRPAAEVLSSAQAWIERDDPRPWFCMVNLYDVHWPYLPDESARERWTREYSGPVDGFSRRSDRLEPGYRFEPEDFAHLRDLYDAEMWQLDREVDSFLSRLDLDRTALLITADHGEAFGEGGGKLEHDDVLECQVRVPLIVRPAGGAPGSTHDVPASGVDVAPTLLALAGLPPVASQVGRNLLAGVEPDRIVLVEDRDHHDPRDVRLALYSGHWKLVRLGVGESIRLQLFDLRSDVDGVHDVAAEQREVVDELARKLDELRAQWKADDVRDLEAGGFANLDALRGLGYVGEDEPPKQ